MATTHQWTSNESKANDEETNDNKQCIVLVGTTKVGKSSLIKLFCGNDVLTSSSVESCTKGCAIFNDQGSSQKWMDTQGTDDSDMKDDDEVILKQIFKKLYDQNVSHIKLIWVVSGDMDGGRGEYRRQAKFIQSFMDGDNESDKVWKSCLIIHKRGKLVPSLRSLRGVIAVASDYGANYQFERNNNNQSKHLLGYTCIDWMSQEDKADDDLLMIISELTEQPKAAKMLQCGYLNCDQVKRLVTEKLNNLPSLKLKYLNEQCTKCGIQGDHRFISANCHTEKIKIHSAEIENYHPEQLHYIHPSSTYQEPSVSYTSKTEYHHSGHVRFIDLIFYSRDYWSCCDRDLGAQGCCSKTKSIPHTTYTTKYRCCGQTSGSNGCTQKYTCCNGSSSSIGCAQRWTCCTGNRDAIGCVDACALCRREWGNSGGCTSTNFMSE